MLCLNYAGCKDLDANTDYIWIIALCLNYAGCKVRTIQQLLSRSICYALTMRDVKDSPATQITLDIALCLNYAGCKVPSLIERSDMMAGYALTMRDVKFSAITILPFDNHVMP